MSDQIPTVHIDGGSRGNPGPASYAFVLRRPGQSTIEECDRLGTATNNVAEYTALIRALELAVELGIPKLAVYSDSELMVKQMKGEYRVKSADLQDLYQEACGLRKRFEKLTLTHVRREFNSDADRLCNLALDGSPRPRVKHDHESEAPIIELEPDVTPPIPTNAAEPLRDDAIACLAAAANSWATHGLGSPTVEEVWDQIHKLLKKHDVLKKKRK